MICRLLLTTLLTAATTSLYAQDHLLMLELNKLEPQDGGCRVYLVFENPTNRAYESLRLDLVVFDPDGVISHRLAVEGAPLAADKTTVKLFEIPEVDCAGIGRVLLNDVLACRDSDGEQDDCLARLRLESRAAVPFAK